MSKYNGCFQRKRKQLKKKNAEKYGELTCEYCGKAPLVNGDSSGICSPNTATIDHFIPVYLGGGNRTDNLFISCHTCNREKNNLAPFDFRSDYFNDELTRLSRRLQRDIVSQVS